MPLGDHESIGAVDAVGHGLEVQRHEREGIDYFDADSRLIEPFGGRDRAMAHQLTGDQRQVLPSPNHLGATDLVDLQRFGDVFLDVEECFVLEVEDGIRVVDCGS